MMHLVSAQKSDDAPVMHLERFCESLRRSGRRFLSHCQWFQVGLLESNQRPQHYQCCALTD